MERIAAERLSPFGHEFLSPEEERAYSLHTWLERTRRLRVVAAAAALFYLAGFAVDLLLLGPTRVAWALLAIRAVVAVTTVAAVFASSRSPARPTRLDGAVTAVMLLVSLATCLIIALSPGEIILHALTVIVVLLVFYLWVPNRTLLTSLCGIAFSAGFVVTAVSSLKPHPNELALVILYLLLVNVLGFLVNREVHGSQRLQFATLAAERQARDVLRREVEARVAAERELAASEERYRSLVELSPNAIVVHRDLRVLYVNQATAAILGVADPTVLCGQSVLEYVAPEHHAATVARMQTLATTGERLPPAQIRILQGHGRTIEAEVVSSLTPSHGGVAVQTVLRDVTERKRLEDELTRLATMDPLTGARNRRSFFQQGDAEVRRAIRHRRPLASLMLDIDHFKRVNDDNGHAVGDEVLSALGEACRSTLRVADFFGRLGGEEFAFLLPEVDAAAARVVAERLRRRVAEIEVRVDDRPVTVTVSIGVSELREGDRSLDHILKRADDALYAAKQAGRDRVFCPP